VTRTAQGQGHVLTGQGHGRHFVVEGDLCTGHVPKTTSRQSQSSRAYRSRSRSKNVRTFQEGKDDVRVT